MPNIRIKDIPTTASATSSTDFIGIDGSANGTRKLNAYSPTFGGNLTVSGTGTSSFGGKIQSSAATATGYNQLYDTTGITTGRGAFAITSTGAGLALGIEASVGGTSFTGSTAYASYFGTTTATPIHFVTNAAIRATIDSAGATTLSGNLTVSGTGTSSFGGVVQVSNTLAAKETNASLTLQPGPGTGGINYAFGQGTGDHVWYGGTTERMRLTYLGNVGIGTTSPLGVLDVRSTTPDVLFNGKDTADPVLYFGRYQYDNVSKSGAAIKYVHGSAGGSQEYGRLAFLTATGSFGALTERMRINESGNVLIGTTVDSSALLQVGTNTSTAAGGMKFGTDTSLYRSQTGMLALDGLTGSLSQLDLRVGGVQKAFVAWNGGDFYLGAVVGTTVIKSSNTTALTLDSSQNATFAGTTKITNGNLQVYGYVGNNAASAIFLNEDQSSYIYNDGAQVNFRSGGIDGLKLASGTGNATFAGTVKIANTAEIKGVYTTTTTFDFGTIANNDASSVCTLTMTGVSSSDSIIVSPTDGDNFPQFCTVSAVPSGNTVAIRLYNGSGSSRTVGSRSIRVTAIKF